MFELSRDVRFAIDPTRGGAVSAVGPNGTAGKPPVARLGECFYTLTITVAGEPGAGSGYLLNIKDVDAVVRDVAIPIIAEAAARGDGGGNALVAAFDALRKSFPPFELRRIELALTPYTQLSAQSFTDGSPMIYLRHTFEFAASHRLHDPSLSEAENVETFGKCCNPHGHGHNYKLVVTLRGTPDASGMLVNFTDLEAVVEEAIIKPLDHKHLNHEVTEFMEGSPDRLNPSTENIAKVAYERLKRALPAGATLDAVTVWETDRTSCEYREDARPV